MSDVRDGSVRTGVRIIGFPVRFRPGFLVFLVLLTAVYPWPLGILVALSVAVFTVIHELGHAIAARRAGCRASISLDFMVAYASYEPVRPLTWVQRAVIAVFGPALQVSTALVVLAALGTNPFSRDSIVGSEVSVAVWWAGIALGLLNLVPVMPLDGGAVVSSIVDHLWPRTGRRLFLRMSLAVTIVVTSMFFLVGAYGLLPLSVFMLFVQWQQVRANDHPLAVRSYVEERFDAAPSFVDAVECAVLSLDGGDIEGAVQWLRTAQRVSMGDTVREAIVAEPRLLALRGAPGASAEWFADL